MMPGSEARADPTVNEIEAQIAQVWQESEPLIEQYNGVHEKYKQNLAKQAELTATIAPLEAPARRGAGAGRRDRRAGLPRFRGQQLRGADVRRARRRRSLIDCPFWRRSPARSSGSCATCST